MNKLAILLILLSFILSCSNSSTDLSSQIQEDMVKVEDNTKFEYDYEENENLDSLEYDYYVKYINNELIGKKQHSVDSFQNESFKIYLGSIYCADVGLSYDVITRFDLIQVADGQRGNSRVIFLGVDKKTCRIFERDMPYELPILIQNNELLYYIENDTIREGMSEGLLPVL